MEEQQIQDFVHQALSDRSFQGQLRVNPALVIGARSYSQQVAGVLSYLIPVLLSGLPAPHLDEKWWHV